MIKVPDVVEELLLNDEVALEGLQAGLLNFSAYADKIHGKVEKLTLKPVKKGTIVVAIARLAKKIIQTSKPLKPDVVVNDITVKSPLAMLTYEKTADMQRRSSTLHPFQISLNDLYAVTESITEITLICSQRAFEKVKEYMGNDTYKIARMGLSAVSVSFDQKYLEEPNVLYVFFSSLAAKRITIIEVISSLTEITFVVDKKDLEETVKTLNVYTK